MDIVLLHGFTESPEIWVEIQQHLTLSGLRVLAPAHLGNTPNELHSRFNMADMAKHIHQQCLAEGFQSYLVAGHSMGGYVALQMLRQFPESVQALALVQSTARADGEEKQKNRTQLAKILREKGSAGFLSAFIPSLFAEQNREKLSETIVKLGKMASAIPANGLASQTEAMRDRLDSLEFIQNAKIPILFLPGKLDPLINLEDIVQQANGCQGPIQLHILENSGHMSIFEEYERTLAALHNFIDFALFHQ